MNAYEEGESNTLMYQWVSELVNVFFLALLLGKHKTYTDEGIALRRHIPETQLSLGFITLR